jgi:shikimate kinase
VIALPPSGLMGGYLREIKKANGITAVVTDKPENILERIRFFDMDSRPIEKKLTPNEKKLYLKEIKKEITYFRASYQRANLQVDISGLDQDQATHKVKEAVEELEGKVMK